MKKFFFIALVLVLSGSTGYALTMGDFNGDTQIDMNDVACWYGWFQATKAMGVGVPTASDVWDYAHAARKSLSPTFFPALPDKALLDLDSKTGDFDMSDVAILYGFFQYVKANATTEKPIPDLDSEGILEFAKSARKSLSSSLAKFPSLEKGDSNIVITIPNITYATPTTSIRK